MKKRKHIQSVFLVAVRQIHVLIFLHILTYVSSRTVSHIGCWRNYFTYFHTVLISDIKIRSYGGGLEEGQSTTSVVELDIANRFYILYNFSRRIYPTFSIFSVLCQKYRLELTTGKWKSTISNLT